MRFFLSGHVKKGWPKSSPSSPRHIMAIIDVLEWLGEAITAEAKQLSAMLDALTYGEGNDE